MKPYYELFLVWGKIACDQTRMAKTEETVGGFYDSKRTYI